MCNRRADVDGAEIGEESAPAALGQRCFAGSALEQRLELDDLRVDIETSLRKAVAYRGRGQVLDGTADDQQEDLLALVAGALQQRFGPVQVISDDVLAALRRCVRAATA